MPAALRGLPLPALTLQPLVENAIVHGLEPQIAGGRVRVDARSDGRSLVVPSTTTAPGSPTRQRRHPRAGSGTALANIRRRLEQTYGSGASLDIGAAGRTASRPPVAAGRVMTTAAPALIADDEPNLAAYLRELLKKAWPALDIVAVARNGVEAAERSPR